MAATLLGSIRKRVTAPDTAEGTFAARGFDTSDAPARQQLETATLMFLVGYEFAIEHKGHDALVDRLETLQREFKGFAYEGAVMALAMRDVMSPFPGNKVTETFMAGPDYDSAPGSKHVFMGYIGLGFALARLPKMLWQRALPDQSKIVDHPSLRWMVMDGYGFHMAFFDHRKWVDQQYVGQKYPWDTDIDYTNRVIDQGIGRGMWFVYGGSVERLLAAINRFPEARRADLFSGAGVAASYAGGVDVASLELLLKGSGQYRAEVAQGAVFALRARVVSDLLTPHNELAAQVFCGCSAQEASDIAARDIVGIPDDQTGSTYELFRQRIMQHFR